MKIVLLENLGVIDAVIQKHSQKLANMPLDVSVVREAEKLKFIDVAFTDVDQLETHSNSLGWIDVCKGWFVNG